MASMTLAEQLGNHPFAFDKTPEQKSGIFKRITRGVRSCIKNVFESPSKALTKGTVIAAAVLAPTYTGDQDPQLMNNLSSDLPQVPVAKSDPSMIKVEQLRADLAAIRATDKKFKQTEKEVKRPTVDATSIEKEKVKKEQEAPLIEQNVVQRMATKETVPEATNNDLPTPLVTAVADEATMTKPVVKSENLKRADFSEYTRGSFVSYQGNYYFVKNVQPGFLVLKDIQAPEGSPFIKVQEEEASKVKPAYAQEIISSLQSYVATFGMNATEIAKALGLEKWQKNIIFSAKKTFADDRKIDTGRLYGLPDAKVVTALFEKFQAYLNQFKIGDKYIFKPEGAEALECDIISVKDGNLHLQANYKGKLTRFKITPQDWQKVSLEKVEQTNLAERRQLLSVDKKKQGVSTDQTHVSPQQKKSGLQPIQPILTITEEFPPVPDKAQTIASEAELQDLMQMIFSEITNAENPAAQPSLLTEKPSQGMFLTFLEKNENLARDLALGYFPKIDHTKELTAQHKKKMASIMFKMYRKIQNFTDQVQLEPKVAEKAKVIPGKESVNNYLFKVLASENSGNFNDPKMFFPSDGGMSWGPKQMQRTYADSAVRSLKKVLGNQLPEIYNNLKFDELEDAYAAYLTKIEQIKALGLGDVQMKEQIAQAKIDYIKSIREINSPVIFNPSVIANLVLANAIEVHSKINKVERKLATTKLASVNLTQAEKSVLEEVKYQMGNRIFDKKHKSKVIKMGYLKRFMYAKKKNPELTIFGWFEQIGFHKATIKALKRKSAARELHQQMTEFQKQTSLLKLQELYEKNKPKDVTAVEFVKGTSFKKTPANMKIVLEHRGDLSLLKNLLAKSKNKINADSSKRFIKMIAAGLVNNPGLSVADVLDKYIERFEVKMFDGKDYSALVENLKVVRSKLISLSEGKSKQAIDEIRQVHNSETLNVPGQVLYEKLTALPNQQNPQEISREARKRIGYSVFNLSDSPTSDVKQVEFDQAA